MILHTFVAALLDVVVVGPTVPDSWAAAGRMKLAVANRPDMNKRGAIVGDVNEDNEG